MFTPEDDSEILKKASYAAYNDAAKAAYRTLAESIFEYFEGHRELYADGTLDVPLNFRPLKDYERTLKIQKLTLRLALRAAQPGDHPLANGEELLAHANAYAS